MSKKLYMPLFKKKAKYYAIKFFLSVLFFTITTFSYAQANEKIKLPLEIFDQISSGELPKRELDLYSIIPDIYHEMSKSKLYIISPHVTFESVTYYIIDEAGHILQSDILILHKNIEIELCLSELLSGTYKIVLEINETFFQGYFDIQ